MLLVPAIRCPRPDTWEAGSLSYCSGLVSVWLHSRFGCFVGLALCNNPVAERPDVNSEGVEHVARYLAGIAADNDPRQCPSKAISEHMHPVLLTRFAQECVQCLDAPAFGLFVRARHRGTRRSWPLVYRNRGIFDQRNLQSPP